MKQFNFTNIERRMPKTGEVACIDRMTSDYAAAHPFNVDNYIESVYQEFANTEFEEPREVLRQLWDDTLLMPAHGDPSVFPNKNGARRAAAMKVWHKAGDYWRKGFRLGDTLPDIVPMTRITRLGDGWWISLFPKDVLPLNDSAPSDSAAETAATSVQEAPAKPAALPRQEEPEPAVTEPVRNQSEPQQLDLFAFQQLQHENERLRQQLSQAQEQPRPRRQRASRISAAVHPPHSACPAIPLQEDNRDRQNLLKAVGMVAVASVALFIIYETGLLIPLGLIGLATGGLLK